MEVLAVVFLVAVVIYFVNRFRQGKRGLGHGKSSGTGTGSNSSSSSKDQLK
jgi:hypothetical protein